MFLAQHAEPGGDRERVADGLPGLGELQQFERQAAPPFAKGEIVGIAVMARLQQPRCRDDPPEEATKRR